MRALNGSSVPDWGKTLNKSHHTLGARMAQITHNGNQVDAATL